MAFSDLTKQIAAEAIRSATAPTPKPAPPPPEGEGAAMIGQIQAMQRALKEDEELAVLVHTGVETLRVMEFFFPTWQVAVLTGMDKDKTVTRVVQPVASLQLVCKVLKSAAAKPARITFVAPKAKA